MRLCVLASSSSGNSTLVEAGGVRVLIDAGLPGSRISKLLASVGVEADSLEAIVVSHEHRDHITGVGVLARRFGLPVYINAPTYDRGRQIMGELPHYSIFENGRPFRLGDLEIEPFSQPHDAADPVGFVCRSGSVSVGLAMDLGKVTGLVQSKLAGCRAVILESNHDEGMLMNGPYSWPLKQRIRSDRGHLSNAGAARTLLKLIPDGTRHVLLGHISKENNQPDLALATAREVLTGAGLNWADLHLTYPDRPSRVIEINGSDTEDSR
jgi:phosphoribosyl 1,2-cyclic phosphodiesterase